MNLRRMVFVVFAVLSVLATGCGPPAVAPQKLTVVVSDQFKFEPELLTVQLGQPVQITMKNDGRLEHDFTIVGMPAKGVKNDTGNLHAAHSMPAGTIMGHAAPQHEAVAVFTPTQKGSYEFFCSVPGHKEAGMKGTLNVG